MNTPRYIVKRIGNDYQIYRTDPHHVAMSSLTVAGGVGLSLFGLLRSGLLGKAALIAGAGIAYFGATGKNPVEGVKSWLQSCGGRSEDSAGPSHQHDQVPTEQRAEDDVDEASMESFPASDAPAHSRST